MSFFQHLTRRRLNSPCINERRTKVFLFEASEGQDYAIDVDLLHDDYTMLSHFLENDEMEIRLLDGLAYGVLFVGILLTFLWSPIAWMGTSILGWLLLALSKYRAGKLIVDRAFLRSGVFLQMHEAGLVWRLMPGGSYEPISGWPERPSPIDLVKAA